MRRDLVAASAAALFLLMTVSALLIVQPVRGAPTIDYIQIVDAPGGSGLWVSGRNYLFGDTDVFWAAGYNLTSGWVGDVSAYWSVGNNYNQSWPYGVVRLNVSQGPTVQVFTSGYGVTRVYAYWYAGNQYGSNATGALHVSVANVGSVVVRTARGGLGTWVGPTTYVQGERDEFYAAAYNTAGGFLGDITSNWTSSNPVVGYVDGVPGGQCDNGTTGGGCYPYAQFYAHGAGFTYVTAAPVGTILSNTTGKLTVIGIDSIRIVDLPGGSGQWVSSRNYLFADTDTFWAAAYNNTLGWLADIVVYWSPYPNPSQPGSDVIELNTSWGSTAGVRAIGYGVTTARITYYIGYSGVSFVNDTGPLRVSVSNVDSVVIRTSRGGFGTWVGSTVYDVYQTDTYWAAAYNATQGYLGDIVSNWTSTDPRVATITGRGVNGRGYAGYFYALSSGITYGNATPVGTNLWNRTGRLAVGGAVIEYVTIRDRPNGGGTAMGNRTYFVGEQDTFYAAAYNRSNGYRGDAAADWTSSNNSVCTVSGWGQQGHGSSAQILLRNPGTCTVTAVASTSTGPVTNTTGTLTVRSRTLVTVDDSGGKDFTKIQDAVDFAQAGYTVFVYAGVYREHVVVPKELEIVGETRTGVVLDGNGTGTALRITGERVVVHSLTVLSADIGVFLDRTNNTQLYRMTIKDYRTGLFNDHTLNAWVAYNLITQGEIGVVANRSYDDAIRWNEISFNTVYGAKAYNARLRNCFNWNALHDNKVAYFYDPDTGLPPYEFDGNVLVDNEVGVKVENTSAMVLTNNTFTGGLEGVQLLNSSSVVDSNTFTGVRTAIRCRASGSNLTNNVISASDVGILCDGGAPRIEGNDILASSGEAVVLSNVDGAIVAGNDLHGGVLRVTNSRLAMLAPVNSVVLLEDSTVDRLTLDATSRVEVRWTVRVRAIDAAGAPLPGHDVVVRDANGAIAFQGVTGSDGSVARIVLHAETLSIAGTESWNPFTFTVTGPAGSGSVATTVTQSVDVTVAVFAAPIPPPPARRDPVPIVLLILATATSASLAGALAVERSRYGLLSLFLPLYSRLSKDKVLESYSRGRVYQYVELNPGAHFNGIRTALEMNNGALVYHLEVLQREGLLRSRTDGMYRRFYTAGTRPPPVLENGTSEVQFRVLKAIQEMPGITQKELARVLGLRQSTLAYQVDRLAGMGYVAGEKRGRRVHYTAKKAAK